MPSLIETTDPVPVAFAEIVFAEEPPAVEIVCVVVNELPRR